MFPFGTGHALARIQQEKSFDAPISTTQYKTYDLTIKSIVVCCDAGQWSAVDHKVDKVNISFTIFFINADIYFDCDVFIIFVRDSVHRAWLTIGRFFLNSGVCAWLMYGRRSGRCI